MTEKHTNFESLQAEIEVGKATHKGMVRTHNEDSILSIKLSSCKGNLKERFIGLYAVADGLGGYEGGEIASNFGVPPFSVPPTMRDFPLCALTA